VVLTIAVSMPAPSVRVLFCYRHISMFVFFRVSMCYLLTPLILKFYTIVFMCEDVKEKISQTS